MNELLIPLINHIDIDDLLQMYMCHSNINNLLESKDVLFRLSEKYNLSYGNTFSQFVEFYDRKYLTKHCLKYYSSQHCLDILLALATTKYHAIMVSHAPP